MRLFSLLLLAFIYCAATVASTEAPTSSPSTACTETRLCSLTAHWDPVQCRCVPDPTVVPTPTPSPSVAVVTLTFNLTLTVSKHASDASVKRFIIRSMRTIANDTDISLNDLLINGHDLVRLTAKHHNPSTWRVVIGFTGQAEQDDPVSGAQTEEFAFIAQASQEADKMKIKLKFVSSQGPAPATVDAVTMAGDDESDIHIIDAADITSTQSTMTAQTCVDGTTIAATATCPITGAAMTTPSSSSSSSSSARLAMIIAPVVGGVALLLVFGTIMMVARRRAAAAKSMEQIANQQELATRV